MTRIRVTFGEVVVAARLNDSNTTRLLQQTLPFETKAQQWGDEVYFETPLDTGEENAQADVPMGTVAYWPPGKALCLFFGQRPYSPVNVFGTIEGDANRLADVEDGETVQVEQG